MVLSVHNGHVLFLICLIFILYKMRGDLYTYIAVLDYIRTTLDSLGLVQGRKDVEKNGGMEIQLFRQNPGLMIEK